MESRQALNGHRVLTGNRQLEIAVIEKTLAQPAGIDAEVFPSQGGLDRDLPNAYNTKNQFVCGVS